MWSAIPVGLFCIDVYLNERKSCRTQRDFCLFVRLFVHPSFSPPPGWDWFQSTFSFMSTAKKKFFSPRSNQLPVEKFPQDQEIINFTLRNQKSFKFSFVMHLFQRGTDAWVNFDLLLIYFLRAAKIKFLSQFWLRKSKSFIKKLVWFCKWSR